MEEDNVEQIIAPVDVWGLKTDPAVKAPEGDAEVPEPTEPVVVKPAKTTAPITPAPAKEPETEPAAPEVDVEDFTQFFGAVEAITGDQIEGEFDNTAEGIAGYITAAKSQAVNAAFSNIQNGDPRAYAYLVHRANNGNDADFFQTNGAANLPTIEQVKANPVIQEQVMRNHYYEKGLGERETEMLITSARDDHRLAGSAEQILTQQLAAEAQKSTAFLAQKATEDTERQAAISQSANHITSVVQKGDLNGWQIPKQDQNAFLDYLGESFDYIAGKPYLKIELTDENLGKVLQSQFMSFKNGNLDAIVKRAVGTAQVQRLKMKVAEASKTTRGPSPETSGGKTSRDIW